MDCYHAGGLQITARGPGPPSHFIRAQSHFISKVKIYDD